MGRILARRSRAPFVRARNKSASVKPFQSRSRTDGGARWELESRLARSFKGGLCFLCSLRGATGRHLRTTLYLKRPPFGKNLHVRRGASLLHDEIGLLRDDGFGRALGRDLNDVAAGGQPR